MRDKSCKVFIW